MILPSQPLCYLPEREPVLLGCAWANIALSPQFESVLPSSLAFSASTFFWVRDTRMEMRSSAFCAISMITPFL